MQHASIVTKTMPRREQGQSVKNVTSTSSEISLQHTSTMAKNIGCCTVCDQQLASSQGCLENIFDTGAVTTSSKQNVAQVLGTLLDCILYEDDIHSTWLCEMCFKLFNDVDSIEISLKMMKEEIVSKFQNTKEVHQTPLSELGEGINQADEEEDSSSEDIPNCNEENSDQKFKSEPSLEFEESKRTLTDNTGTSGSSDNETVAVKSHSTTEMVIFPEDTSPPFHCSECTIRFPFAKQLSEHLRLTHNIKIYICEACQAKFPRKQELAIHEATHVVKGFLPFKCYACKKSFEDSKKFKWHLKVHLGKLYPCTECGKRFFSRKLLQEHRNGHRSTDKDENNVDSSSNGSYPCQTCGKSFRSKPCLRVHQKLHWEEQQIRTGDQQTSASNSFPCLTCTKSFLSLAQLKAHERCHRGANGEKRDYDCEICGRPCHTLTNLQSHLLVHTGEKPFACSVCGKAFSRKQKLKEHGRMHTGEKPFQCEQCGATFRQQSNLINHKRNIHTTLKPFHCEICGKAFKRRRLVEYHTKSAHTGERSLKCDICSATFVYPHHYKKHLKIHTGEKPFKCEICGKAFNSKDNRNAHRFIHSEKKPYECKACGQGFMRKPALYNHMQNEGHMEDIIIVNQLQLPLEQDDKATGNTSIVSSPSEKNIAEEEQAALPQTPTSPLVPRVSGLEDALSSNQDTQSIIVNQLELDSAVTTSEGISYILCNDDKVEVVYF